MFEKAEMLSNGQVDQLPNNKFMNSDRLNVQDIAHDFVSQNRTRIFEIKSTIEEKAHELLKKVYLSGRKKNRR